MWEIRLQPEVETWFLQLCITDPAREAIFLMAGDRSGQWREWYEKAIPLADARFAEHLRALTEEGER